MNYDSGGEGSGYTTCHASQGITCPCHACVGVTIEKTKIWVRGAVADWLCLLRMNVNTFPERNHSEARCPPFNSCCHLIINIYYIYIYIYIYIYNTRRVALCLYSVQFIMKHTSQLLTRRTSYNPILHCLISSSSFPSLGWQPWRLYLFGFIGGFIELIREDISES